MDSGIIKGAVALAKLLDYQEEAVVSRTLIKEDTGTVSLFAFDKGQGLSEHTAPFNALVYILEGEAKITIDNEPFKVKAQEMIVMPANKPHALLALQRFKMLLIMIKKLSQK